MKVAKHKSSSDRKSISEPQPSFFGIEIKIAPGELTARFSELTAHSYPFGITITPLLGQEPINVKGRSTVEAIHVDGWHKSAASRRFTLEDIAYHTEENLGARLAPVSPEELKYKDSSGLRGIEAVSGRLAEECALKEFGRVIQVSVGY